VLRAAQLVLMDATKAKVKCFFQVIGRPAPGTPRSTLNSFIIILAE
jgi:hypothetical protein